MAMRENTNHLDSPFSVLVQTVCLFFGWVCTLNLVIRHNFESQMKQFSTKSGVMLATGNPLSTDSKYYRITS